MPFCREKRVSPPDNAFSCVCSSASYTSSTITSRHRSQLQTRFSQRTSGNPYNPFWLLLKCLLANTFISTQLVWWQATIPARLHHRCSSSKNSKRQHGSIFQMQLLILCGHFQILPLFIHYALRVSLTSWVHSCYLQCVISADTSKT